MSRTSRPTPINSLAIVGASGRAAAFSALRAGLKSVVADLFADVDLASHCSATKIVDYPHDFLPWLKETKAQAWLYTGGLENFPELVDAVPVPKLLGNSGDVLRSVRSPERLQQVFAEAGISFPETRHDSLGLPVDGSWLVKPRASCGGTQVRRFFGKGQGAGDVVYQQVIEGLPCSALFVGDGRGNAMLLGVTEQLLAVGENEFQYIGSIGPCQVTDSVEKKFSHIGNTLAAQFELIGLFGVDAVMAEDRAWVIEVNPRYTASVEIIERVFDCSCMALHWRACTEQLISFDAMSQPKPIQFWGKQIAFATEEFKVSDALEMELLDKSAEKPWPLAADVPKQGTTILPGQPIATLFASGDNKQDVAAKLSRAVASFP